MASPYILVEEVTGGKVKITVRQGPDVLYSNTFDICDLVPRFGLKCPVPKGPGTHSATQPLPPIIPKVSRYIHTNVRATGKHGHATPISCALWSQCSYAAELSAASEGRVLSTYNL